MRKIIHVDMDCFFAQVEMRDNPALRDVPLAIGGLPGTRGVLCTSNYVARKFGVKSAMPTDYALRLCPKLIIMEPNFKKYSEASARIQSIFTSFSDLVEPVSLDEAYIDASHFENASSIALEIKKLIKERTGLTASVGLAPNKFLAKIASDWKKPDGLFIIRPKNVETFVKELPIKLIPGIGKKGQETLHSLNILTCDDLKKISKIVLHHYFGVFSENLYQYARGEDSRIVVSNWERKSLGVETTFTADILDQKILHLELSKLYTQMKNRLEIHFLEEGEKTIKKIFVKVKFNDFSRASCEETLYSDNNISDFSGFASLLGRCLQKKTNPVRLIGLGIRFVSCSDTDQFQLSLFP